MGSVAEQLAEKARNQPPAASILARGSESSYDPSPGYPNPNRDPNPRASTPTAMGCT